jgi:hypothetical protein
LFWRTSSYRIQVLFSFPYVELTLMKRIFALFTLTVLALCISPTAGKLNVKAQSSNAILRAQRPISNQYVVTLKRDVFTRDISRIARSLAQAHSGKLLRIFAHAGKGFSIELPEAAALALSRSPFVDFVEENGLVGLTDATCPLNAQEFYAYSVDRIDQRSATRDGSYCPPRAGRGVNIYVLDSGIWKTHNDFAGRAQVGWDAFRDIVDPNYGLDCETTRGGHGTKSASISGGSGIGSVAKSANIIGVRIAECNGYATFDSIRDGINWVARNRGSAPAVISLGVGDGGYIAGVDRAATDAVNIYGITFVAAAGNSNKPVAGNGFDLPRQSPAWLPEVITVGALASSAYHYGATGVTESRAGFSNYGSAVDLFAPSYNNYGAATGFYSGSNSTYGDLGGTSAARAVVAGVAAMYLEAYPNATPAQVQQALIDNATVGALDASTLAGSPNRVIYSNFIPAPTANNFSFSAANYNVGEGDRNATVTVNRSGNVNNPASVDFATVDTTAMNEDPRSRCTRIDGQASERCDYATTMVTLQFAPGESSKNVTILINDDARAEGNEIVPLSLTMAKSGGLSGPNNATLTVIDNENVTASFNPIDDARFFVRAHYVDFLSREPTDPDGISGQVRSQFAAAIRSALTASASTRRVPSSFHQNFRAPATSSIASSKAASGVRRITSNSSPT